MEIEKAKNEALEKGRLLGIENARIEREKNEEAKVRMNLLLFVYLNRQGHLNIYNMAEGFFRL